MSNSFDLQCFLPFRLARLAAEVSQNLADIYSERFDINVPEWRVLATLGDREPVTAQQVVASTRTHKSTISRAVDSLSERGWIEKVASSSDRREIQLRFTDLGKQQFAQISKLVLDYELSLMESLDGEAQTALDRGIEALEISLALNKNGAKR